MSSKKIIAPGIVKAKCLDCSLFYEVFSFEGYGSDNWPLRCSQCNNIKWTGSSDSVFEHTIGQFERKYGRLWDVKGKMNPRAEEFLQQFEATCDICECGGSFRIAVPDICPKCYSRNVSVFWDTIIRRDEIPMEPVTHFRYLKDGDLTK